MSMARLVLSCVAAALAFAPRAPRAAPRPTLLRSVAESLRDAHMATLARLASNLKNVKLEDIEEVFVTDVYPDHVKIQVMTCEADGCVSLLVPIEFQRRCDEGDGFDECVIENVVRLDAALMNDAAARAAAPARPARRARYVTYQAEDAAAKPAWWPAAAPDGELSRACAAAREILNDQFHDDVAAIAARRVERAVDFAVVEELCPAGFLVGVGGAAGTDVVDFRFKCVAQDVDELHAAVVGAVADAQRADDDGAADPWAPF